MKKEGTAMYKILVADDEADIVHLLTDLFTLSLIHI